MLKDKGIWKAISLLLPTTGMLALYAYIATFSRLTGDDYCLLYFADRFGLLRSIWYWYLNFEGIFSGVFTDYFLVYFGEKWMGVVLPAILLVLVGNASFSFGVLLEHKYHSLQKTLAALALGIALVVAVFVWSPYIQQSYYWWAGTRKYVMPLIFISLYPGLYLRFIRKDWSRRGTLLWYLVSFAFLFFTGGYSETLNPGLFVAFLFVISLRLWLTGFDLKDKSFWFLVSGFVGFLIAFAIMVLSPGNSVRQGFFAQPSGILTALQVATLSYLEFLALIPKSWILSSVFIGLVIGTVNIGVGGQEKNPPKGWIVIFTLAATFVIPWACFAPYAYVTGEPLVLRAMIDPAFLFTAFLMYSMLLLAKWLDARTQLGERAFSWISLTVLTVALLSVSLLQAGRDFYALSEAHREYAKEWESVQVEILRAVNDERESLIVPKRENWAGVLELNDNPKFYVNQCISGYYGIQIKTR